MHTSQKWIVTFWIAWAYVQDKLIELWFGLFQQPILLLTAEFENYVLLSHYCMLTLFVYIKILL